MLAHALASFRYVRRAPAAWFLALGALAVTWFALGFEVLAVRTDPGRRAELVSASAGLAGIALVLWCLARLLEEDARSGFALAADTTAPGPGGRLIGRWAGALLAGLCATIVVGGLAALTGGAPAAGSLSLCIAMSGPLALTGAWCILGSTLLSPGRAAAVAGGLWILGHLPWGRPPLLSGLPGAALRAWLPSPPLREAPWSGLAAAGIAAFGLVLIASRVVQRSARADPMV